MDAYTNAQDAEARVDGLWNVIAGSRRTSVDIKTLKKGLRKLDHPLKNADELLAEVMKAVDTDQDGRIQYNEFRTFVQETEKELLALFKTIDHNHDNKLTKDELQAAFRRAGLSVPNSKLEQFFGEMDVNGDGSISFEEWRNFLLFIPATAPNMRAVLTYYNATTHINPEGDVDVASDDVIQGLGMDYARQFLKICFGSLILISQYPQSPSSTDFLPSTMSTPAKAPSTDSPTLPPRNDVPIAEVRKGRFQDHAAMLIPDPGYFVAGGLAGVASRTSTAPLDRLKVYLIAQTSVAQETVAAAKSGNIFRAALNAWRPLSTATKELWQAGGMRSLYAGNGLNVVKVMPESAIKFGAYEAAKRLFAKIEGHNDPTTIQGWSKFVAGGLAGMISQFAVYPIDTLKFRMQCETVSGGLHGNRLIMATALKMWRNGGIVAYYRGLPMGLVGIFPYAALDLGTFEYLKRTIASRNARKRGCHEEDAQPGGFVTAAIGGFSGAFGASAVYPLNLLRTRLQSQGTVLHPRTYTGITDVTRQTLRGEGVRGLFKGLTPNLLKVIPAVSITYVVYDKSKAALGLR